MFLHTGISQLLISNISIIDFAKDIRDSAIGLKGYYYSALENSPYLRPTMYWQSIVCMVKKSSDVTRQNVPYLLGVCDYPDISS